MILGRPLQYGLLYTYDTHTLSNDPYAYRQSGYTVHVRYSSSKHPAYWELKRREPTIQSTHPFIHPNNAAIYYLAPETFINCTFLPHWCWCRWVRSFCLGSSSQSRVESKSRRDELNDRQSVISITNMGTGSKSLSLHPLSDYASIYRLTE